jgi:hypothetical protein
LAVWAPAPAWCFPHVSKHTPRHCALLVPVPAHAGVPAPRTPQAGAAARAYPLSPPAGATQTPRAPESSAPGGGAPRTCLSDQRFPVPLWVYSVEICKPHTAHSRLPCAGLRLPWQVVGCLVQSAAPQLERARCGRRGHWLNPRAVQNNAPPHAPLMSRPPSLPRINSRSVLVVPPFEAAWLSLSDYDGVQNGCCLCFEYKGGPQGPGWAPAAAGAPQRAPLRRLRAAPRRWLCWRRRRAPRQAACTRRMGPAQRRTAVRVRGGAGRRAPRPRRRVRLQRRAPRPHPRPRPRPCRPTPNLPFIYFDLFLEI